ncbi:MAG TPA: hypothetical protein DEP18_07660, partial [Flavobacteriales bacterium]|nr:hypothetical protein [Flavobacteriales bacterium]
TSITGTTIWLGFVHMQHLARNTVNMLLENRHESGAFESLEDLVARLPITLDQLVLLIRMGSLRFTGKSKQELLWQ